MVDEWLKTTIHRLKPFVHRRFRRFDEWLTYFCKIFQEKDLVLSERHCGVSWVSCVMSVIKDLERDWFIPYYIYLYINIYNMTDFRCSELLNDTWHSWHSWHTCAVAKAVPNMEITGRGHGDYGFEARRLRVGHFESLTLHKIMGSVLSLRRSDWKESWSRIS